MTFTGNARVILVANRKGGVGKSSITAAAAQTIASGGRRGGGHRVLVIDGDPQGTITKSDFGQRDTDEGASLGQALSWETTNLMPVRGVKPNLDVIPGGSKLARAIAGAPTMAEGELAANLQQALERLCAAEGYDFVFIDSAPGEMPLLDAFLNVANYMIIPTKSDEGSLDAVEELAQRFWVARGAGATVALLGVVLFGVDTNASVRNADIVDQIKELLAGSGVDPFSAHIRHNEGVAVDLRSLGVSPAELVTIAKQANSEKLRALRRGEKPSRRLWGTNPVGLAGDYQTLVYDIVSRIAQYEAVSEQLAAAGGRS